MSAIYLLIITVISLLFSAFFSGMEIAFISSSKIKIELDNKKGEFSAKILSFFNGKPAWFIAAMLIGNNVAMVIYTLYITQLIEPYLLTFNFNQTLVLLIQTLFSTFFIFIICAQNGYLWSYELSKLHVKSSFFAKITFENTPSGFTEKTVVSERPRSCS